MAGLIHASGEENALIIGERNLDLMIDWLTKWGYSSPRLLAEVCGCSDLRSQKRLMDRMIKNGYAKIINSPDANVGFETRTRVKGKPQTVSAPQLLIPTKKCHAIAQDRTEFKLPKPLDWRSSGSMLFHDYSTQTLALRLVRMCQESKPSVTSKEVLSGYSCREFNLKNYDAIVRYSDDHWLAIETEINTKRPDGELYKAFEMIHFDIESPQSHVAQVYYCLTCDSERDLYQKHFNDWTKTKDGEGNHAYEHYRDDDYKHCFRFFTVDDLYKLRFK
jgi:hypothetical protein